MTRLAMAISILLLAGCGVVQERHGAAGDASNLRIADAAMRSGLPQTTVAVTRDILQSDPRNTEALLRQGAALEAMKVFDAAEECYRRALQIEPGSANALRGLGRARLAMGQAQEAERAFRDAIDAANDAGALNDLGIALDMQERHSEAQAAYQAALTREPHLAAAQVNLGLSLALAGATDRALAILRPLARDPGADERVRQDFAVALALAGDETEAGKVLAADLPQDKVSAALAGYLALRIPGK
jgi:Flp pilus assembly protein TadD